MYVSRLVAKSSLNMRFNSRCCGGSFWGPINSRNLSTTELFGGMTRMNFLKLIESAVPFSVAYFNPIVLCLEKGHITVVLPYRGYYGGVLNNSMHTGPMITIVDQMCGYATWSTFEDSTMMVNTIDLTTNFFGGVLKQGDIFIDTTVIDVDEKRAVIETKCYYDTQNPMKYASNDNAVLKESCVSTGHNVDFNNSMYKMICSASATFNIYKYRKRANVTFSDALKMMP